MPAQWPIVLAQLVTVLPTLDGWDQIHVYDGPVSSKNPPRDFVTVGFIDDPDAGSYSTVQDPDGYQRQESGEIRGRLTCQTGSADLPAVRTRVFALMDALDLWVRSDRRLGGVLSPEGTSSLVVNISTLWNTSGTAQTLGFALSYTTVT